MSNEFAIKSLLTVTITEHNCQDLKIPKNLVISNLDGNTIESAWLLNTCKVSYDLLPDTYVIDLFLSSRHRISQTAKLVEGEQCNVSFVISPQNLHEVE